MVKVFVSFCLIAMGSLEKTMTLSTCLAMHSQCPSEHFLMWRSGCACDGWKSSFAKCSVVNALELNAPTLGLTKCFVNNQSLPCTARSKLWASNDAKLLICLCIQVSIANVSCTNLQVVQFGHEKSHSDCFH